MPHPQMVVFNADRPVGRETILKADTKGPAPAGVTCRDQTDPGGVVEYVNRLRVTAAPPLT